MKITERGVAEALHRTIERDPNPHATTRGTLLSEGNASTLLLDAADETGANGQRTFLITVREVDPPEGPSDDDVATLAALIQQRLDLGGEGEDVARHLLHAGVTL